jgi:hypothetical protein
MVSTATPMNMSRLQGSMWLELLMKHALFRDDNASLHHCLKDATRSTAYAASIKLFQRRKDGRRALLALINQYAGNNKWEAEVTNQHSRVVFKLDAIQSNDAGLQAAIGSVRTDGGPTGKRSDSCCYPSPSV